MPVKTYNFEPAVFLVEFNTQCNIASIVFHRLQQTAPGWYSEAPTEVVGAQMSPRDIMINCAAFLSAAAVISKILFPGARPNTKVHRRCERLRMLLEIGELPTLQKLSVRNSFEHVDERLDSIFKTFKSGSIAPISVDEDSHAKDTLVLKRFDPRNLTIAFLKAELSLPECIAEIDQIDSMIDPALKKLFGSRFDLHGS